MTRKTPHPLGTSLYVVTFVLSFLRSLAKHGLQEQEVGHALVISPPFDLGHVGLVEDGLDRHDVLLGSLRGAQSASEAALLCIGRSRHARERVVVGRRRHYERPGEHDVRHRLLPPVRGAPERAEGGADSGVHGQSEPDGL